MRILMMSCRTNGIVFATLLLGAFAAAASLKAAPKKEISFRTSSGAESVISVTAASPGSRWDKAGAEAPVATVYLDGHYNQDIIVDHGSVPFTCHIFLGPLGVGEHQLAVERNSRWSAPDSPLEIQKIAVRSISPSDPESVALAHAPVLYARADTLGQFSDVPLVAWCEVLPNGDGEEIQYSYVFSNEDAGTPPAALMARWGRTTDIEYAYRVWLDRAGKVERGTFQGFSHQDTPFRGMKDGNHPYLLVAMPNNVFADTGVSEAQYHMLPVRADLTQRSREELMDRYPWTYRIMAEELKREDKLRDFGQWSLANVGDPRNYLYLEMNSYNESSGLNVWVKVKRNLRMYSSDGGHPELAIWRSGWFRTTVELPPGTNSDSIEEVGLQCVAPPYVNVPGVPAASPPQASTCAIRNISKAFLLDRRYRPEKSFLSSQTEVSLKPGQIYLFTPDQANAETSSAPGPDTSPNSAPDPGSNSPPKEPSPK